MALRKFVLIFCLSESDSGLVEILAREGALLVEILTAVVKLLLRFQRYLRRLRITLRLLDLFRQSGGGRDRIRGLRLIVCSLIVLSSGRQVAILQCREQLPGMNFAAAIDIERFNRRADLRNNRRLGLRVQDSFGRHRLLDGRLLDRNHLNADRRLRRLLGGATQPRRNNGDACGQRKDKDEAKPRSADARVGLALSPALLRRGAARRDAGGVAEE